MERVKMLQSGLDASFTEFTRTASQAKTFVEEAAGILAAQFEGVPPEQLSGIVCTPKRPCRRLLLKITVKET
jgi:hypothetical protein